MLLRGHATTPDLLRMTTDAAGSVDWHIDYAELDTDNLPNNAVVGFGNDGNNVASATTTTIATGNSGDATRLRKVLEVMIRNRHASISQNLTIVRSIQGGTEREIVKVLLEPGETLEYTEAYGWQKLTVASISIPVSVVRLAADVTSASTTAAEATGLTKATGTGTFMFTYLLLLQSAATTTGHKFDVNYDGTATSLSFWIEWLTAATTASDDVPDQDHVAAPGGVMSGFSARSGGTTGTGQTTDVDATNSDVLYRIQGVLVVTVAGNLELWWAPEAAANATLKAGSSLQLTQTA